MLIGSVFFTTVISYLVFLYIRTRYREYDRIETEKENIAELRAKIKMAQEYFRLTYEHNVFNSIKLNLDFCLKLILKKDNEGQVKYLKELYNSLYETGYRLKTRFDDVNYITAPMKSLREKLVIELSDYIKENTEGLL